VKIDENSLSVFQGKILLVWAGVSAIRARVTAAQNRGELQIGICVQALDESVRMGLPRAVLSYVHMHHSRDKPSQF
jgi:hypothetical protein